MIPKEGGNKFSGAFFGAWSDGRLAEQQLDPGAAGTRPERP